MEQELIVLTIDSLVPARPAQKSSIVRIGPLLQEYWFDAAE